MHNQENRTRSYGAKRYPAFLIVKGGIALRNSVRIVENENGSFKPNVMLTKVLLVLVLVSHSNRIAGRDKDRISIQITDVSTFVRTLPAPRIGTFMAQTP
jgi:hypothetical protein